MKELLLLVLTVVTVMAIPKPIREELQPAIKGSSDQPDSRQLQNQLLNILEARVLEKKKNDPLELDERWMEGCYTGLFNEHYDGPTFTEPTGVITSPGWRRGYFPLNINCLWIIEAPAQQSVEVTFDKFQLSECGYENFVILVNGAVPSQASKIDYYCGTYADNSKVVTSTGNVMGVEFSTNSYNGYTAGTDRGFKLRWRFVQPSTRALLGQMVDLLEHRPGLENQEN